MLKSHHSVSQMSYRSNLDALMYRSFSSSNGKAEISICLAFFSTLFSQTRQFVLYGIGRCLCACRHTQLHQDIAHMRFNREGANH
jgi:hypothetical protein